MGVLNSFFALGVGNSPIKKLPGGGGGGGQDSLRLMTLGHMYFHFFCSFF